MNRQPRVLALARIMKGSDRPRSQRSFLVAERKPYVLRLDPAVFDALQRWAGDELRSLNAQLEFLLRQSLKNAGRLPRDDSGQSARRAPRPRDRG